MIYSKLNLASADEITAKAMNLIETMAENAILDATTHTHDDVYLSWEEADELYWCMDNAEYCDADTLDGSHGLDLFGTGAGLPIGTQVFWDGLISSIPAGWQLADGTNGTLDMRDYFPVCTSASLALGATTGANSKTPSGTVTVGGTVLTEHQTPAHFHGYEQYYLDAGSTVQAPRTDSGLPSLTPTPTGWSPTTNATGGSQPHIHNGTWEASSFSNLPPYLALYIIERVS